MGWGWVVATARLEMSASGDGKVRVRCSVGAESGNVARYGLVVGG